MSRDDRPNILIIMSDEHDPAVMGCSGHQLVRTPNLDRLAGGGTVFDNAYCNNPICCPSRMSFLTGKYCHRIGVWDNGSPLRADIPTFAHYFTAAGYDTVLCGRMHMVGGDRLHGFGTRLFDDLDVWQDYRQAPRRTPEARRGSNSHVTECGPGHGAWYDYDTTVTDLSVRFLKGKAAYPSAQPWLLVSGLMYPHFPLTCPPEYYRQYDPDTVTPADLRGETLAGQHPAIRQLRYFFRNDREVPEPVQRRALASYYGLVTLTDDLVGNMLDVVDNTALRDNTVVIYVSDHGEMAGQHGIWQKQCFYESSVRVPMIVRTPHGAGGQRIDANVSLVDVMPTILDLAGIEIPDDLPGDSLKELRPGTGDANRAVFSEYHAQGMLTGGFMIKRGDYKYHYYVGHEPQLFNVREDAGEFQDLAGDERYGPMRAALHQELLNIANPEQVSDQALRNQEKVGPQRAY
jgi:choline-sulfatase